MSSYKESTPLLPTDTTSTTTIGSSDALSLRNWLQTRGFVAEETVPTVVKAVIVEAEGNFSQIPVFWQRVYISSSVISSFNLLIIVAMFVASPGSGIGIALAIYSVAASVLAFVGVLIVGTYHATQGHKLVPARVCKIAFGVVLAVLFFHMIVVIALFAVMVEKADCGLVLGIYSLVFSILLFLGWGFGGSYYVGLMRGMGARGYGIIVENEESGFSRWLRPRVVM
ncbi:hypothetical protein K440DRAFT_660630 [Wilcoxina mikolae CBS 423.85]|nr:hypothetical protein K440DRAFT_660630 [Wilcoxina mikolae CBS 423.85]